MWLTGEDLKVFSNLYEYVKEEHVNQQVVSIVKHHSEKFLDVISQKEIVDIETSG